MTIGQGELTPGFLLDILAFGTSPTGKITVDATAVAYSNSFPLRRGMTFGWEVMFDSAGSVNCKVELEQGNARPTTEGVADAAWVVPDNKAASPMFAAITDKLDHQVAYAPNAMAYGRLKFTGITGNNAATQVVTAKMYSIKNF